MSEFGIATAAAVAAGVILALLGWVASKEPTVREWLVPRPWAIAGLVGFAVSLVTAVAVTAIVGAMIIREGPQGLKGDSGTPGLRGEPGPQGNQGGKGDAGAGLPIGAIVAFDVPEGCPPGDEWKPFNDADGRTIIGASAAGSGSLAVRKFRVAGGEQQGVLIPANIPPLNFNVYYVTTDDLHSSGATVMRNLSSSPNPGNLHTILFKIGGASQPFPIEMPYIPLFLCKKIK